MNEIDNQQVDYSNFSSERINYLLPTSLILQDLKPGGGLRLSARYREHLTQSTNERMEWETTTKRKIKLLNHVTEFYFLSPGALRTPARPNPHNMYMREGIQHIHSPPFFPPAKAGEITSAKKVAKTKSKTYVYENVK